MDRLDELAIFLEVLQHGSLAAAARKLRRSAPAVTRAIASLEQRFGARLVERTTRRLAPTEAGLRLAERAAVVLSAYNDAVQDTVSAQLKGLLRITAPVLFGRRHVAPLVMEFQAQHPEIQIELILNDRNLEMIDQGIDVAVRIGNLADSSKVARRLGEVSVVVVASPEYLEYQTPVCHPADLAAHQIILSSNDAFNEWRFGPHEEGPRVRLSPHLLFNDVETRRLAVIAGKGIARLLSYQVADELANGTLVRLLPEFEPLPLPVQLVVQNIQRMPIKVRAFWDFSREKLSQLPQIHSSRSE
ncbi:LysR family transcriptional regulator [Rouxiella badensis]|uniref:LysR family transcriptional regulator n=1 Tax=Rouxiella badensis TaxID=1646377 RepID=UPI0022AB31A1|nr:LysR family transcriptional regulator [Rouxiella badensis]WAT07953.1 LysR family transcriptional regulator [Rouxiella badensis]